MSALPPASDVPPTAGAPRARRRPPVALLAGAAGSLALALSMNGTLSAFTAQIQNSTNTAATGYLAMKETLLDSSGNATSTTCSSNDGSAASVGTNSATCSTINKYGGTTPGLIPGGAANVTKISLTNTGTVPASTFSLTPSACSATAQSTNGGASTSSVCAKFKVVITSGSTTVFTGTADQLTSGGAINLLSKLGKSSVAAGEVVPLQIAVSLDSSADNTYAGFQVSQPLTWNFTA